jgi:PIN domain nuclease of toxin-antitoxin system
MRILLDTHIWLWYGLGNPKLSQNLQTAIADPDNELWLSPISIWEALLLAEKGRMALPPDILAPRYSIAYESGFVPSTQTTTGGK